MDLVSSYRNSLGSSEVSDNNHCIKRHSPHLTHAPIQLGNFSEHSLIPTQVFKSTWSTVWVFLIPYNFAISCSGHRQYLYNLAAAEQELSLHCDSIQSKCYLFYEIQKLFPLFHWGCKQDIISVRQSQSGLNLKITYLLWLYIFILADIRVLTFNQTTLPGIGSWWFKGNISESVELIRVYFKIRLDGLF